MKTITLFLAVFAAALGWLTPAAHAQTCAPPTNVSVSPVLGTTTAVISFTPSATALSYTVRYYWIGDSTTAGMMSVNTTTSPVTLTGLRTGAGAYYRVSVMSNCAGGLTTGSPWVGFQVGGGSGPGAGGCGSVTGLSLSSGPTVTYVNFQPVAGALSYTVRFQVVGDSSSARTMTVNNSPATFTGSLLPATQYIATVVTNCGNGTTTPATSAPVRIQFTTPPAVGTCGQVSNVRNTAVSPTSVTVSFVPVAGALNYTIRYWTGTYGPVQTLTVAGSPVTFTGLQPGTNYDSDIIANCPNGAAPAVAHGFATTTVANCGPVTNVTITATGTSTASISFTPGAGNSGFYISWSIPGDSLQYHSTYTTSTTPVTLNGLIPGQTYVVQVQSICGVSGQPTSNTTGPISFAFRGALAVHAALGAGVVELFPNPAHHTASVVLPAVPGAARAQLTLLNALGQAVRTQAVLLTRASETRVQLDLAGLAPGLYSVRVAAGGQSASQRLVVE
ncbi:fibronectin type III domain-containing protein [Hymenobacter daeguensis]